LLEAQHASCASQQSAFALLTLFSLQHAAFLAQQASFFAQHSGRFPEFEPAKDIEVKAMNKATMDNTI
jgi:hypothetical protein